MNWYDRETKSCIEAIPQAFGPFRSVLFGLPWLSPSRFCSCYKSDICAIWGPEITFKCTTKSFIRVFFKKNQIVTKVNVLAIKVNCFLCFVMKFLVKRQTNKQNTKKWRTRHVFCHVWIWKSLYVIFWKSRLTIWLQHFRKRNFQNRSPFTKCTKIV